VGKAAGVALLVVAPLFVAGIEGVAALFSPLGDVSGAAATLEAAASRGAISTADSTSAAVSTLAAGRMASQTAPPESNAARGTASHGTQATLRALAGIAGLVFSLAAVDTAEVDSLAPAGAETSACCFTSRDQVGDLAAFAAAIAAWFVSPERLASPVLLAADGAASVRSDGARSEGALPVQPAGATTRTMLEHLGQA
jgi:hypothetical protein